MHVVNFLIRSKSHTIVASFCLGHAGPIKLLHSKLYTHCSYIFGSFRYPIVILVRYFISVLTHLIFPYAGCDWLMDPMTQRELSQSIDYLKVTQSDLDRLYVKILSHTIYVIQ